MLNYFDTRKSTNEKLKNTERFLEEIWLTCATKWIILKCRKEGAEDGFERIFCFRFLGRRSLFSITQNGLTFNKAVVLKLGSPAFVRFLINEETHQVALQVCEESAPKAVAFYRPKKNGVLSVRWSSQDLVSTFKRLLANNFQEHGYRIDGELVENGLMLLV